MGTTFFLDTCVLDALLDGPKSSQKSKEQAKSFVSEYAKKDATLVCPAIARIELVRHLYEREKGQEERVSFKMNELSGLGIFLKKDFDIALEKHKALFESVEKNYAVCKMSLADALIAADAKANNAVLVTFDLDDYKKCHKAKEQQYYDFKHKRITNLK